jgi:periplasmic copper chaperone A
MRLALAALFFVLLAPVASAHVTILPASARPGQTPALHFRVLNERSDARTVEIDIFVPRGLHATASQRRGWRLVEKPGEFDWVARDSGIGGADAKDFELRVGPLPKADQVVFKALQHYSDGQIVRWIQTSSGAERPAPVLALGNAPPGGGGSSGLGFLAPIGVVVLLGGGLLLRRSRR